MILFESSGKYTSTPRLVLFLFVVIFTSFFVVYRLVNLTHAQHAQYVTKAQNQYVNPSARLAGRGNIYAWKEDTSERVLVASNVKRPYLYSNNSKVKTPEAIAAAIAVVLEEDEQEIFESLKENTSYMMLARSISEDQADQIESLNFPGLIIGWEVTRFYPQDDLAAHALGFVGFEGNSRVGQYGVESSYDALLAGQDTTQRFFGNKTYAKIGSFFSFGSSDEEQVVDEDEDIDTNAVGEDIVLTIDSNIQSFVEAKLRELIDRWSAESGIIIVQEPTTGAILAMSSFPQFDPNRYWDYQYTDYINPSVQRHFEPGSSFKPITMAAALDSGAITPNSTYNDTGVVEIGGYEIRNSDKEAHGIQTMREVLMFSLNTGTIYAQKRLGNDAFLNYMVEFGFSEKTGIDLPGELKGNISNLYSGRDINFYTASFGQGIAITPLQLINSYSAIANGGRLMRPYIVREIVHANGSKTVTKPDISDVPISEKTATQMKTMLSEVVSERFPEAQVSGYNIAGKTGTAQIPDKDGGYSEDEWIHSFVGFAPAYTPEFTILIKLDKPREVKYAANSLTPVFGEIANYLLHYYKIPPTN